MTKETLKRRAGQIKRDIPAVLVALSDKRTPLAAKLFAALAAAFALSPVDLIPDFIPVLGYLDDLIIVPALIALAVKRIPKDVLEECRSDAESANVRKKWYFAIPALLLWMILIIIILKVIL